MSNTTTTRAWTVAKSTGHYYSNSDTKFSAALDGQSRKKKEPPKQPPAHLPTTKTSPPSPTRDHHHITTPHHHNQRHYLPTQHLPPATLPVEQRSIRDMAADRRGTHSPGIPELGCTLEQDGGEGKRRTQADDKGCARRKIKGARDTSRHDFGTQGGDKRTKGDEQQELPADRTRERVCWNI